MKNSEQIVMKNSEQIELDKYSVVNELCEEISNNKTKHHNKFIQLRKINTAYYLFVNSLNGITTSSLFMGLVTNPSVIWVGASLSSITFLLQIIKTSYKLDDKLTKFNTSSQQYADLLRSVKLTLAKNNLSSSDILELISDINIQLSLIEDSNFI